MRKLFLVGLFLCAFTCARAEGWGMRYTDPPERDILGLLIPTDEDVPYYYPTVQYELIKFRGCEFWPEWWGQNFHAEKKVRYGPLFSLRGVEGMLICPLELISLGPASNDSLPINNSVGIGFSIRFEIGWFRGR